jgi:competence protein ComEA
MPPGLPLAPAVSPAGAESSGDASVVRRREEAGDAEGETGVGGSAGLIDVEQSPASPPALARVIDVNSATAAQLEQLPRIGPTLAQRIVEEREANGPFTSVDDLTRVRGIGEKTVDGLRGLAAAR